MTYKEIKGKKHYIFKDIHEFETFFLERDGVVPTLRTLWRDGQEGEWVQADDGGVIQVIRRNNVKAAGKFYVRTCLGYFFGNKNVYMDTDPSLHQDRHKVSGLNEDDYQNKRKRAYLTKKDKQFVAHVLSGKSIYKSYTLAFGEHVRWQKRVSRVLGKELVMKAIYNGIGDSAKSLGITVEWVLGNLKEIVDDKNNGPTAKISAIKELTELMGMKGNNNPMLGQSGGGFSGFLRGNIPEAQVEQPTLSLESANE